MNIKNNPGSSYNNKKLAIISTNETLINNINEIIHSPDDIIKEPDLDSFLKNSVVNFKNTGFIICDIDSFNCDRAAGESGDFLKKFADGFSKEKNYGKDFQPPIIFTFSKFKSHIFENSILNAEYEKFLGFFKIDEISETNDRLFSLIRNYLYPTYFNEGYTEIGKIFINDFKEIDDLKKFYNTNKSASLFIGKNREEMLRLRADIIQNKDEIKKMVTTVIAKEINTGKYDLYKHLDSFKKDADIKKRISNYFEKKEKDWNGYSILILGDTGVGKSLVVRWIVNFLNEMFKTEIEYNIKDSSLNCSNLNPNTFESEFFGSLEGAATDIKNSPGMVLGSTGNVLFLDEIGALDMRCQAKLLTYLQDFQFRPFGYQGTPLFIPNIIVAATNEKINDETLFRKDLYHRFKTIIKILPINERHEVLDILIDYVFQNPFINPVIKTESKNGENSLQHRIKYIDTAAYESLKKHKYPGNFRELEAVIREACARAIYENSSVIKPKHLSLLSA